MPGSTSLIPHHPLVSAWAVALRCCQCAGSQLLVLGTGTKMLPLPTTEHGFRTVPNPWTQWKDRHQLIVPILEHQRAFPGSACPPLLSHCCRQPCRHVPARGLGVAGGTGVWAVLGHALLHMRCHRAVVTHRSTLFQHPQIPAPASQSPSCGDTVTTSSCRTHVEAQARV